MLRMLTLIILMTNFLNLMTISKRKNNDSDLIGPETMASFLIGSIVRRGKLQKLSQYIRN